MPTQKIAIGRIVGLSVAVVCAGVTIWLAREGLLWNAKFHQWLVDRPMDVAVDFSRPGETTAHFRQTCSVAHSEAFMLSSEFGPEAEESPEKFVQGLAGEVVIRDLAGREVVSTGLSDIGVFFLQGEISVAGLHSFPPGDYIATIRVDKGVPSLAGKPQRLRARYLLCGLEQLPALIAGAIALVSGISSLAIFICVLPGLCRSGFRVDVPPPDRDITA